MHQARCLSPGPPSYAIQPPPCSAGCAQAAVDRCCTACLMYNDSNASMIGLRLCAGNSPVQRVDRDARRQASCLGHTRDLMKSGPRWPRAEVIHATGMKSGPPRIHGRKMWFAARGLCRAKCERFYEKESAPNTSGFSKIGTFASVHHPCIASLPLLIWHLPKPNPPWPRPRPRSRPAPGSRPA